MYEAAGHYAPARFSLETGHARWAFGDTSSFSYWPALCHADIDIIAFYTARHLCYALTLRFSSTVLIDLLRRRRAGDLCLHYRAGAEAMRDDANEIRYRRLRRLCANLFRRHASITIHSRFAPSPAAQYAAAEIIIWSARCHISLPDAMKMQALIIEAPKHRDYFGI